MATPDNFDLFPDGGSRSLGTPELVPEEELRRRLSTITYLDVEAGLQSLRGKITSYARLLAKYAVVHAHDVARLREQLTLGNLAEARRLAHSLKGASGTVGARDVEQSAQALEAALKAALDADRSEAAVLDELLKELELAWSSLTRSLVEVLGRDFPAAPQR